MHHRQGKRRREWVDDDPDPEERDDDLDTLAHEFKDGVHDLHRSFRKAAHLEWLRFKARLIDSGIQGILYFFVVSFFLAIFLSGGVFIAQAIRDSLGNLVAGFTILGVVLIAGLIFRAIARGKTLKQARRTFHDEDDEDDDDESDGRNET